MPTQPGLLDLYDIAVLLNYERSTTEPRLRHTKLREVAFPGYMPTSVALNNPINSGWIDNDLTWIVLDHQPGDPTEPDLPSNMPRGEVKEELRKELSDQKLETLFHRARNHNGCYQAVGLLQIFFDLFPEETKLRVRHAPKDKQPGDSYLTTIHRRIIIEEEFVEPTVSTAVCIANTGMLFVCGNEPRMDHAVVGFSPLDSDNITTILDLSSMQFGDAGRGPGIKGKQTFALDNMAEFEARWSRLAAGTDTSKSKQSRTLTGTSVDDWLTEVAIRAKKRWDERATSKWCAHCGAPDATFKCGKCRDDWYCDRDHQLKAWKFHQGYCSSS